MAGNAALLSVFSIIAKVISALYRVPLTSVLGAEGMGMVSACIFHLRADTCADYGRNPRCGVKAHERE